MNRRGFLGAILAASMAPAIARSGVLMPIYVPKPDLLRLWGDGMHDDTLALQAIFDGKPVFGAEPFSEGGSVYLSGGIYRISSTILIGAGAHTVIGSTFIAAPELEAPMLQFKGPGSMVAGSTFKRLT